MICSAVKSECDVAPLVHHLGVPFRAQGVGGEHVPVAFVVKGVVDDLERIARARIEVLFQIVDDDVVGRRVVRIYAHVQVGVVVQDANLGRFRRRFALVRLVLQESGGDWRITPGSFVERAVDRDWRRRPDSLEAPQANRGVVAIGSEAAAAVATVVQMSVAQARRVA